MRGSLVLFEGEREIARLPLEGGAILVGRSPQAALRIDHPCVSRGHLRLEERGDAWWAVDLGSRNGTFLEGPTGKRRLAPDVPLAGGAVLRIGPFRLLFEGEEATATDRRVPPEEVERTQGNAGPPERSPSSAPPPGALLAARSPAGESLLLAIGPVGLPLPPGEERPTAHVEERRDPKGSTWWVRGSGESLLDGSPCRGEHPLSPGSRIDASGWSFRFLPPGGVVVRAGGTPPASRPEGFAARIGLLRGSLLAGIAVASVGAWVVSSRSKGPTPQEVLAQARGAIRTHAWGDALRRLEELSSRADAPPEAAALKALASSEESAERALAEAEERASKQEWEEALVGLGAIPTGSAYRAQADALADRTRSGGFARLVEAARASARGGRPLEARSFALRARSLRGEGPEAASIAREFRLDPPSSPPSPPPPRRPGKAHSPPSSPPAPPSAPGDGEPAASAMAKYASGDLDGALREFQALAGSGSPAIARRARELRGWAASVKRYLGEAEAARSSGALERAWEAAERGLALDARLPPHERCRPAERARTLAAQSLAEAGERALGGRRHPEASRLFQRSLAHRPDEPRALQGMAKIREAAVEWYREAYVLDRSNPERAADRLRSILLVLPPGEEYHQKAKARLEEREHPPTP